MTDRTKKKMVLYGTSGQALYVYEEITQADRGYEVVAFMDLGSEDGFEQHTQLPLISLETWKRDYVDTSDLLLCPGTPSIRRKVAEEFSALGARFAQHSDGDREEPPWKAIEIGVGTYVGPNTMLGNCVKIGEHTQLMINISIGHDVTIGDYVTIAPGAIVSGYVEIEDDVFVGAGAIISNGTPDKPIVIGRGSMLTAGTVVIRSVPPQSRILGVPGRPL
ncbi:acetyltransferase [Shimia marina]|uniref:Putative acetyltransferase EpsM n=1 Tax=Shimia marina TaxID=321267 RepID=A0A0P1F599_9RHOB|nr:acetyltransferase [Shimia marina]CUH50736.1 Putative acetyltransferase EpsM [Shimia marina]SFE35479.1 sugar O-acyltransferase, sialic acid O-acetyltransferase NeuD family [Shimia marina]